GSDQRAEPPVRRRDGEWAKGSAERAVGDYCAAGDRGDRSGSVNTVNIWRSRCASVHLIGLALAVDADNALNTSTSFRLKRSRSVADHAIADRPLAPVGS